MELDMRRLVTMLMLMAMTGTLAHAATEPDGQNNAEAIAKAKAAAEKAKLDANFAAWVATKPADQQKWEHVLEANLGGFYLPLYQKAKLAPGGEHESAWDYVADQPGLPRVLLIGDSISRGYTVPTRHKLAGKVNLHRAPANCGPTTYGLEHFDAWLGDGKWDLIHFNFGIHDVNRRYTPEKYAEALEQVVERLKKTGAKLVWASSTPLRSSDYHDQAIVQFNAIAAGIMARHHIPIDDLYTAILPHVDAWQNEKDRCHFGGPGYEFLGDVVSKKILQALSEANGS
jgi:lysophospholipase L1-like esterase